VTNQLPCDKNDDDVVTNQLSCDKY